MRECVSGRAYKGIDDKTDSAIGTETDVLDDERLWTEEFEPQPASSTQAVENKTTCRTLATLAKDKRFMKVLRSYGQMKVLRLLYLCEKRTSAHYLNKAAFIIETYLAKTGSDEVRKQLKLFQQLWRHCYEKNKVMICTYVGSRRQKYYLVQLEPKR